MAIYRYLADLVVVIHATYVSVVVFGLAAILVGAALRWGWVRNFWFRLIHLAMIALVVLESLFGIPCPLTDLEDYLRRAAGEDVQAGSFIGRWVHNIIFYDCAPQSLTLVYCLFGGAVLATMIFFPPRLPFRRAMRGGPSKELPSREASCRQDDAPTEHS